MKQGKKFEQIDALRFFAVLPVLTAHWEMFNISASTQFLFASNGVNLFFAISGFLITLGLLRSREKEQSIQTSLWKFYIRRILRIFPLYYLLLILLWLFNHKRVADGMLWYLSYSTNFYNIKIQNWGGLPHLWSLAVEEQFYLLWPFVILLTPNRLLPYLIGSVVIASITFKIYCLQTNATFWILYMNPIAVLDVLGMGALLSYFYYFQKEKLKNLLYNKLVIGIVLIQLIFIIYCKYDEHYDFCYQVFSRFSFGLFSAWLIGRSVFGFEGVVGYILTLRPLVYIGKISYGVYLFHMIIPGMLMGIKYPIDHILRCFIYFVVTLGICSISWRYFESRILKFKDKFE